MPPLSEDLAEMQDFYRFEFLPDGYPGRDDGWAHPIYGTYVLNDYLKQHAREPSPELKEGIRTVAEATIDRMDDHRGALVFWYEADPDRGARLYQRHYSGLTQGYYAVALHRAGEVLGDADVIDAAARVFDSLLIPTDEGGVLTVGPHGPGIAEVPQVADSWILNGWQSALLSMAQYAEVADDDQARDFVDESAQAMAAMLPLYDLPDLANSRYGLTGFLYVRLLFDQEPDSLGDVTFEAGDLALPLEARDDATRWEPHLFGEDVDGGAPTSRSVRANVVPSRIDTPNRLRVDGLDGAEIVTLEVQQGRYDPRSSAPVDTDWREVATAAIQDGTANLEIPDEVADTVTYPTNFLKEIDGEHVNVYHPLHVIRLRQLAEVTGVDKLEEWADRWESYICRWADMEIYAGLQLPDYDVAGDQVIDPGEVCARLSE